MIGENYLQNVAPEQFIELRFYWLWLALCGWPAGRGIAVPRITGMVVELEGSSALSFGWPAILHQHSHFKLISSYSRRTTRRVDLRCDNSRFTVCWKYLFACSRPGLYIPVSTAGTSGVGARHVRLLALSCRLTGGLALADQENALSTLARLSIRCGVAFADLHRYRGRQFRPCIITSGQHLLNKIVKAIQYRV